LRKPGGGGRSGFLTRAPRHLNGAARRESGKKRKTDLAIKKVLRRDKNHFKYSREKFNRANTRQRKKRGGRYKRKKKKKTKKKTKRGVEIVEISKPTDCYTLLSNFREKKRKESQGNRRKKKT